MNYEGVTPDIAEGLLVLKERIKAAKIPPSKLDETINLATWNVRELGKKPRRKAALYYIAEILSQFDLVGLVELRDNLSDLKAILGILGPDWRAIFSDAIPDAGGNRERVAYLYDRRAVVFNGLAAEAQPPRQKKGSEYLSDISWWRSPYLASFRAGNFDFLCLTTHIRWGDNEEERIVELKAVADLCVHCHMCRVECPAGVDIPRLMVEAKAAYVGENGLSASDRLLSRVDSLSQWGSLLAPVANRAIQNRTVRWLMDKLLGIASARKLPRFAPRSYLRQAARRRLTRPSRGNEPKVLYFVDTFANYHDPQLGRALVAVLQHNHVGVFVHPEQLASGMPMIAMGAVEPARRIAAANIRLLAESIRQGYEIVATEPSAVMCLTHEYLGLVDDDDARLVAAHSSDACTYLWRMHAAGRLRLDMRPVHATLGYHLPCHVKALYGSSAGQNLLRLIPGLVVQALASGCSGMAGVYGLKRENFRASLRAGRSLTTGLRDPSIQAGVTECAPCKMQMEQSSHKPTLHPIKILALAYNLMPEIEAQLSTPSGRWVTT